MGNIVVKNETFTDVTILSNRFIDEYMRECNAAQLKVYLYLLRSCYAGISTGISDLADRFNLTEMDVVRCLRFWEEKQLLSLGYDARGGLRSISMTGPDGIRAEEPIAAPSGENITPVFSFVAHPAAFMAEEKKEDVPMKKELPEHKEYSLDEVASFRKTSDGDHLIFLSETYRGKTVGPLDLQSLMYIYFGLGFDVELFDNLLQYCVSKGKKDFRYIEKTAETWYTVEVKDAEQASEYIRENDRHVRLVMDAFGKKGTPAPSENDYINKWFKELKLNEELVGEACRRAVLATDSHRFEYADAILTSWKNKGIVSLKDAEAQDASFRQEKEKKNEKKPAHSASSQASRFSDFESNRYDFDALEKALLQK